MVTVPQQSASFGAVARARRRVGDLAEAFALPGLPRRYVTVRKIANYWRARLAWLTGAERLSHRPYKLTLELTNVCNLRCPHCPTGKGRFGRPPSYLSEHCVRGILDELGPYAFTADLHNWGEPLLHRDACEVIRLCEERGVMSVICTNFNVPFDDEAAENLVRSGLSIAGISLDGADQESYETYRVRGRLEVALRNVKRLQEAKRRLGVDHPRVVWSYLVFRHNEGRVGEARALAERYGMEFCASRGLTDDPAWQTTEPHLHPIDDIAREDRACRWLYEMAVVNADGGISPCCTEAAFGRDADFGAIDNGGFLAAWNNPRYRAARRLFRGARGAPGRSETSVCCEACEVYRRRTIGRASHERT